MVQIKSRITNFGQSNYILIPQRLVDNMNLKSTDEVLATFEKFPNKIKELCLRHLEEKNMVILNVEGDDMKGNIMKVGEKFVHFQSDGEFYTLPFQSVKEVRLNE